MYSDLITMDETTHRYVSTRNISKETSAKFISDLDNKVENETGLVVAIGKLFDDIGIPHNYEKDRVDVLTSKCGMEAKYYKDAGHKDENFHQQVAQSICYQRVRLKRGWDLSPFLVGISNKYAIIIKTSEVERLIKTNNWDDKSAASVRVPERIAAVAGLGLSYDSYNMNDDDDIYEFINAINNIEMSEKTIITKELIVSDFLQYQRSSGRGWKNDINIYLHKLYSGELKNKVSCANLSEQDASRVILEGHASNIINQSNNLELHKHVVAMENFKIGDSLLDYNPSKGGVLVLDAPEMLMEMLRQGTPEENISIHTHHPKQLYEANIRNIEIMTELTKNNILETRKKICLCLGNPPWEKEQDIDVFMKVVNSHNFIDGGVVDLCMNAGWLQGPNGRKFRNFLITKGSLEQITIFTSSSFKNSSTDEVIGKVGCRVVFIKGAPQRENVKIIRSLGNGQETTTTAPFSEIDGVVLYFGKPLKHIHSKFVNGNANHTIIESGNNDTYDPAGKPNIKFSKCSNVNHIGTSRYPFGKMIGSHVISPPKIDYNGDIKYIGTGGSEKRIIEVPLGEEHILDNIKYHMQTRLFGFIFLQVSVVFRTLSSVLEPLLTTVLTEKYEKFEDYERALYRELELTDDDIKYIDGLGANYAYYINKETKANTAITSIERTVERVKETGEVFTPDEIVKEAIANNRYYLHDKTKYIIEPTCGEGAYVVAMILDRKKHGLSDIDNIKNIRAFDLMQDNVDFVKREILNILEDNQQIKDMVDTNIQCGDFMLWDLEKDKWHLGPNDFLGCEDTILVKDEISTDKIKMGDSLQLFDM